MTTILLDSHIVEWFSSDSKRIGREALGAIRRADERAVSAITWWELALLARRGRIAISMPLRAWLDRLSTGIRTVGITTAIAETAASLPSTFPRDPVDRLIYATAIEHGWQLATKDEELRAYKHSRRIAVW